MISVSWPVRLKPLIRVTVDHMYVSFSMTTIFCEIWLSKEKKKHKDQVVRRKSSIWLHEREREREHVRWDGESAICVMQGVLWTICGMKYINRFSLVRCMHLDLVYYAFSDFGVCISNQYVFQFSLMYRYYRLNSNIKKCIIL